ncbi:MAG: hypothetical protein WAV20_14395 [Blastocatellia bacterium]
MSPDGKWVSYVVTAVDMKENASDADVWLVSTAGGPPIRLTTSKKNDNQPRWSPDGKRLAFISARGEKPQIFLISPFGGEAEKLTESKSGVQSFQWSPDGNRIAYVAQQELSPDEEKKQRREYGWFSKYVLGIEVPEPRPIVIDKSEKKPEDKPSH